ncbi:hypothetical protein [Polynucleobacter necessarius]|uniref:hypothetical protein n=1 Tax=Polynucleobacter necessarius TaxID=576610 RepID=UPI000E09CD55|nr:hypothetical protein [Polynucleobacter necessarius]
MGGNPAYGTQNNLYGQPLAYTNKEAWTCTMNMEAQYNYDARRTTNPLYAGVSKLFLSLTVCHSPLAQDQSITSAILQAVHQVGALVQQQLWLF